MNYMNTEMLSKYVQQEMERQVRADQREEEKVRRLRERYGIEVKGQESDDDDDAHAAYVSTWELDATPLEPEPDRVMSRCPDRVVSRYTFDEINEWPLTKFKSWIEADSSCLIDGIATRPKWVWQWARGPWINPNFAALARERTDEGFVTPVSIENDDEEQAPPLTTIYNRSFLEVSSYIDMSSYKRCVDGDHSPLLEEIVGQISGPLIAPADGYGLVLSLRPDSYSGDLHGIYPVRRESILETLQRGGRDLPVVMSYCRAFCDDEVVQELVERPGPVIFVDVSPTIIPRRDLQSATVNTSSYGMSIRQTRRGDERGQMKNAPYSFNLGARYKGLSWLDVGYSLHFFVDLYPHLLHSSPHEYINDYLKLVSRYSSTIPTLMACHNLSTLISALGPVYFCPIGRICDEPTEAIGSSFWLFSRTVYYAQKNLYVRLYGATTALEVGEYVYWYYGDDYGVRRESSHKISYISTEGRMRVEGSVVIDVDTLAPLFTLSMASQLLFLRQWMPVFDHARYQRFKRLSIVHPGLQDLTAANYKSRVL